MVGMDWIGEAQDRAQCRTLMKVMNSYVPKRS
jgi:hypothetical protein